MYSYHLPPQPCRPAAGLLGTTSPLEAPRSVHPQAPSTLQKVSERSCTLSSHRTAAKDAPEVPPRSSARGNALIPRVHWLHALGQASGIVGNVVPAATPAKEAGAHPRSRSPGGCVKALWPGWRSPCGPGRRLSRELSR